MTVIRSLAYQLGVEFTDMGAEMVERLTPLDVLRLVNVSRGSKM